MDPRLPGALVAPSVAVELLGLVRLVAVRSRSRSFKKPAWVSFAVGRPESIIGNRLCSPEAGDLLSFWESCCMPATLFLFFRTVVLRGAETIAKISNAHTTAPAATITNRFC